MSDISTWSLIAAQNGTNGVPPDFWPEGQAPSTVNDCAREMMRAIKKQFLDAAWVNAGDGVLQLTATKFRVSSSTSTAVAYYAVSRRLRLNDATTLYGTVTEASISATTTNITVALDSGSLTASLTAVAFSIITPGSTGTPLQTPYSVLFGADAQGNDTYVINPTPQLGAYFTGLVVNFFANTKNTGPATLNVSGLGAKTIKKRFNLDLTDGDIVASQIVTVVYDGTNFQMLSDRNTGWEKITSVTAANVATISFTDLSSTYMMYMIDIDRARPATDQVNLQFLASIDNGANYLAAGQYTYNNFFVYDIDNTNATRGGAGSNFMPLATAEANLRIGNAAEQALTGKLVIYNPSSTVYGMTQGIFGYGVPTGDAGAGALRTSYHSGRIAAGAAINAVRLLFSAGNVTSGVFTLYGLIA